jgi:hypothetical protein
MPLTGLSLLWPSGTMKWKLYLVGIESVSKYVIDDKGYVAPTQQCATDTKQLKGRQEQIEDGKSE